MKLPKEYLKQLEQQGHIPARARERRPKKARVPKRRPAPLTGPPQSWSITVPQYNPPSLNRLMHCHWRTKHRLKRECRDLIAHYGRHVLPATGKRRVLLTLVRTKADQRLDADNAKKAALDALTCAGLIGDDNEDWCECPDPVQLVGEARELRIELEEIE